MNHFGSHSVAHGLKPCQFSNLPPAVRRKLVRLMARIAEKSYRRGYQHGVESGPDRCIEPGDLRFRRSLDKSPYTDTPYPHGGHTAIERLFMECGELQQLGFDEPRSP